jgi:hypothetical protein
LLQLPHLDALNLQSRFLQNFRRSFTFQDVLHRRLDNHRRFIAPTVTAGRHRGGRRVRGQTAFDE